LLIYDIIFEIIKVNADAQNKVVYSSEIKQVQLDEEEEDKQHTTKQCSHFIPKLTVYKTCESLY